MFTLEACPAAVVSVQFVSGESRILGRSRDGQVRIWSAENGDLLHASSDDVTRLENCFFTLPGHWTLDMLDALKD